DSLCLEGLDEALYEIEAEGTKVPSDIQSSGSQILFLPTLSNWKHDYINHIHELQFDPLLTGKRIRMKRLVAISGCGHLPREECPKVLLAAIMPFTDLILYQQTVKQGI
ncbi:hypothetical protein Tco_0036039, partial [Tanacetum coccineum]